KMIMKALAAGGLERGRANSAFSMPLLRVNGNAAQSCGLRFIHCHVETTSLNLLRWCCANVDWLYSPGILHLILVCVANARHTRSIKDVAAISECKSVQVIPFI